MKFDMNKALSVVNAISNPKEGIGMALNMLSKKNPQMAQTLSKMIQDNENPIDVIKQYVSEGKINENDFQTIKNMYGLAKKAGLKKFDVPQNVWNEVENAFHNQSQSKSNSKNVDNLDWF